MTMGGSVFRFHPSSFSGSDDGSKSLTTRQSRDPSGDHAYSATPPLMSVNCCASPPARLSSQTCAPFFFCSSSPRALRNARYLPSGLHLGALSRLSVVEVRRICCEPSQLTIHRSLSRVSFSAGSEEASNQSPSIPASRAIDATVSGRSPDRILSSTPCERNHSTVERASGRSR